MKGVFMSKFDKTIYIAGDSTASNYSLKEYPMMGWGQALSDYFELKVDNRAIPGRSTKSFLEQGHWDKIIKDIKKGDYILIQFGHNDSKIDDLERYTVPGDTFNNNLKLFVQQALSKEAVPILLTPIQRRVFKNGKIIDSHGKYLTEVINVANELKIDVIDIASETEKLFNLLGEDDSKDLFMIYSAGEVENYPEGCIDNTHLNEKGASIIAQLIYNGLKSLNLI